MVKKSTVMGENMIKTLLWSGWESKFDVFPVNIILVGTSVAVATYRIGFFISLITIVHMCKVYALETEQITTN